MRESDLPSPDIGGKGHHLRRICANAFNQLAQGANNYPQGIHPKATYLAAFFTACATAATVLTKPIPVLAFTPTSKSYSLATGAGQAGPTLAKGGSTGAATYTSSDVTIATVNSATGAVTPVAIGQVTITVSVAADATYRAWTQPYTATVTA